MRGRRVLPVRMSLEDATEGRIWGKGLRRRIKREKKKRKNLAQVGRSGVGGRHPTRCVARTLPPLPLYLELCHILSIEI